jgi:hypothetical protein
MANESWNAIRNYKTLSRKWGRLARQHLSSRKTILEALGNCWIEIDQKGDCVELDISHGYENMGLTGEVRCHTLAPPPNDQYPHRIVIKLPLKKPAVRK